MGKKKNTFENNMEQLELIIKELEQGNVSLEDMVKKYGEGMMLAKNCIEKLEIAEQDIDIILNEDKTGLVQNKLNFSEE